MHCLVIPGQYLCKCLKPEAKLKRGKPLLDTPSTADWSNQEVEMSKDCLLNFQGFET